MPSPCINNLSSVSPRNCTLSERGHALVSIGVALAAIAALTGVLTMISSMGVSLGAYNALSSLKMGGGLLLLTGGSIACFGLVTYLIPSKNTPARSAASVSAAPPTPVIFYRRIPRSETTYTNFVVSPPSSTREKRAYYREVTRRYSRLIVSTSSNPTHLLKNGETLQIDGHTLSCQKLGSRSDYDLLLDSNGDGAQTPGFDVYQIDFHHADRDPINQRDPIYQLVPTRSNQWDQFDHAVESVATVIKILEIHDVDVGKWHSLTINRHRRETTTAGVVMLFNILKQLKDELRYALDKKAVRAHYYGEPYWTQDVLLMAERYDHQMGGDSAVTWWNQVFRSASGDDAFSLDPTLPGGIPRPEDADEIDEGPVWASLAAVIKHTFPLDDD